MYLYIKALHIIFVVTWFAGLFYMVRLFVYNREALDKAEPERSILQHQFNIMIRRLWFGITWPSCVLTLIFGTWMLVLYGALPLWLIVKLCFVALLLLYHGTIHIIYKQQAAGHFRFTSYQLRLWNELATLFLVAIVMLVVLKDLLNFAGGLLCLLLFSLFLAAVIRAVRKSNARKQQ
ncbi:MAG: CopD family protein [Bacteroidota bacterium]